jgi:PAS domain S-box-containing protein
LIQDGTFSHRFFTDKVFRVRYFWRAMTMPANFERAVKSADREKRMRFIGLTDTDCELLRAMKPMFERHVGEIEDAFYDQLLALPETAQLLRDRTTVERLKKLQRDYLMRITEGNFDDAYFDDRLRIGKTHERVGLSPRWYLLAYNLYYSLFAPRIRDFYSDNAPRAEQSIAALQKVFMLDASLAMDAYIASDRIRRLQEYESVVRDSADAIFVLDAELRFRSWNRGAETMLGWRASEIIGKPLETIVPRDLIEAGELARIKEVLSAEGFYRFETTRLSRDGRRVPVELTVTALRDPDGQLVGRSAILRDISARQRLEQEKLHAERLALIGTMSAKLAHEIRNPLSSIGLNLDLLRDEIASLKTICDALCPTKDSETCIAFEKSVAESNDLAKSIHSEVLRIRNVLEDYLKFAKLPRIRLERLSLNELLSRHLSFLQPTFDADCVKLETQFDPALPEIAADEEQLWQAILNIIRNALEAMPDGGTLRVATSQREDAVVLQIADTGCGMNAETREKMFAPFFSTKHGGTGLGLPLTLQIVTEHGGTIHCASEKDRGTTVTIIFPAK